MENLAYLSRNQINRILGILGNFQYVENNNSTVDMADVIHVLYLFEDKEKTKKEREEFLKQFN